MSLVVVVNVVLEVPLECVVVAVVKDDSMPVVADDTSDSDSDCDCDDDRKRQTPTQMQKTDDWHGSYCSSDLPWPWSWPWP